MCSAGRTVGQTSIASGVSFACSLRFLRAVPDYRADCAFRCPLPLRLSPAVALHSTRLLSLSRASPHHNNRLHLCLLALPSYLDSSPHRFFRPRPRRRSPFFNLANSLRPHNIVTSPRPHSTADCKKECGADRAFYMQLQIRSADEPSTTFYRFV